MSKNSHVLMYLLLNENQLIWRKGMFKTESKYWLPYIYSVWDLYRLPQRQMVEKFRKGADYKNSEKRRSRKHTHYIYIYIYIYRWLAQSAGTVEYADCFSTEGWDPPTKKSVRGLTICWWSSGNAEYPLIAIAPRSTLAQSGSTR